MTLPATGPISLGNPTGDTSSFSVNRELYRASPYQQTVSLNDTAVRTLFGIPTNGTQISLADGRGKTNYFVFNLPYANNLYLRAEAISAGWDQNQAVLAVVPSGSFIQSTNIFQAALVINGTFPNSVRLQINGTIIGKAGTNGTPGYTGQAGAGGAGGAGGYPGSSGGPGGMSGQGGDATNGGPAIYALTNVTIDNQGGIYGGDPGLGGAGGGLSGGGGGGGGPYYRSGEKSATGYWETGGAGGAGYGAQGSIFGTVAGPYNGTVGQSYYVGGRGGYSGQAGLSGASSPYAGGGAGGAAGAYGGDGLSGDRGYYLNGSSYVTWAAVGTRQGRVI